MNDLLSRESNKTFKNKNAVIYPKTMPPWSYFPCFWYIPHGEISGSPSGTTGWGRLERCGGKTKAVPPLGRLMRPGGSFVLDFISIQRTIRLARQ